MKKLKIFVGVVFLCFLFRGVIYRFFINYSKVNTRPLVQVEDAELLSLLDSYSIPRDLTFQEMIHQTNKITTDNLQFSFQKCPSNPNNLLSNGKANCVGYSALFTTVANYICSKNNLENIEIVHCVGKLDFLGLDLHQLFNDPFFKDHDYVKIINHQTNQVIDVDPVLYDYFRIAEV